MKSFREQFKECVDSDNCFVIEGAETLQGKFDVVVCVKHKTYCHSKACLHERVGEEEEYGKPADYNELQLD